VKHRPAPWRLLALFLACLAFAPGEPAAAAQDAPAWSAGVASVKITPEKPVILAGYASRVKPHESVDSDLYAKALALKDAQGNRAVLVTMDLCILPRDVAEPVRKQIAEKAGLEPAAVLLSVSHSHSAPAVSLGAKAGAAGPDTRPVNPTSPANIEYTRQLQEKLAAVADQALSRLAPAKLSWGVGVADIAMNRRQFTDKGVILGVNPRGLVDRSVPVLRIDGADGKLRAVLFGYACHCTTVPSSHLGISGDYAGYARAFVQEKYPGAEALFMAGCGGDANPYPRQLPAHAPRHGQTLGEEVCRVLETKLAPISGTLKCALVTASLPLQVPDRASLQKTASTGSGVFKDAAQRMLSTLDAGGRLPESYPAPVAAWQFGGDLTLIALPEEVVVDYVQRLEEAVGPLRLWVAAYCHEVAGYIPSRRVLKEGGYETRGLYIDVGWFSPEVEDVLTAAARDAAKAAGREIPQSK